MTLTLGYSHWLPVLKRRILLTEGFCFIELTRWPGFTTGGLRASLRIRRFPFWYRGNRNVLSTSRGNLRRFVQVLVHFHVLWSALQGPWHWSGLNTHTHTHAFARVFRYFDCLLVYRGCCHLSSNFDHSFLFCRSEGVINHFADFTALLGLWNKVEHGIPYVEAS
jgi:hypothetical protein